MDKIDLVITRHAALVSLLKERNIITEDTPVLDHASISDVKGRHVLGVLPHHLSQHTASLTEVPMSLTKADREAMQKGDLTLERCREVAGDPVTYWVTGSPNHSHELAACHQRAASHAATWAWPPRVRAAQGLVIYEDSAGLESSQVDVYARGTPRYRTTEGNGWGPWRDAYGQEADQTPPKGGGARMKWMESEDIVSLGDMELDTEIEFWSLDFDEANDPILGKVLLRRDDGDVQVVRADCPYGKWHPSSTPCRRV